MVDVLHFFFEEDHLRYESGEQAEAGSKLRVKLYKDLYKTEYKYPIQPSGQQGGRKYIDKNEDFDFDDSIPASSSQTVKPYIPPTEFNADAADPFGGVLDAPIA